jgi:hypothetical protein
LRAGGGVELVKVVVAAVWSTCVSWKSYKNGFRKMDLEELWAPNRRAYIMAYLKFHPSPLTINQLEST